MRSKGQPRSSHQVRKGPYTRIVLCNGRFREYRRSMNDNYL